MRRLFKYIPGLFVLLYAPCIFAQLHVPLYANYTTQQERALMRERVIKNTINNNLNKPLDSLTEQNWQDAFTAMEVFTYTSPATSAKIEIAFDSALERSEGFQRALLELAHTNFPVQFTRPVWFLASETCIPRIFAMCAEYLLKTPSYPQELKNELLQLLIQKFGNDVFTNPTLLVLSQRLTDSGTTLSKESLLRPLFSKTFMPGKTVMYSLQRKNRDYPGLVVLRKADGSFLLDDSTGNVFAVSQLARSITNLPWYLRNGNTPQGIFKMNGYGVSGSNFIGPTPNIQMGMPVEFSKAKFLEGMAGRDLQWKPEDYKALLPDSLKNYLPLYGSYYAGLIGRNEIIAHGTTLDPALYFQAPYYPLTPTMGCLTSMEIWDGRRLESDQQKLINAMIKAGGARGYAVVVEIDDKEAPVTLFDIASLLP